MTRMQKITVKCENCGHVFSGIAYASINTWMDPKLTHEFLKEGLFLTCPKCGRKYILKGKVMISARNGMKMVENRLDFDVKKEILEEIGVFDQKGRIIGFFSESEKSTTNDLKKLHPPPK
ncbi:MAG: hypothetical protein GF364_06605 [Candidatus Lokiarchaeota archaeon]|nr:hypothetical protein [Candidatus Lokiarchaeota archaeon]